MSAPEEEEEWWSSAGGDAAPVLEHVRRRAPLWRQELTQSGGRQGSAGLHMAASNRMDDFNYGRPPPRKKVLSFKYDQ